MTVRSPGHVTSYMGSVLMSVQKLIMHAGAGAGVGKILAALRSYLFILELSSRRSAHAEARVIVIAP